MVISTVDSKPIADAGPDQVVKVDSVLVLDGSASFDPDGDPLTFSWSFVSIPDGSSALLSDPEAEMPTFVADSAMEGGCRV